MTNYMDQEQNTVIVGSTNIVNQLPKSMPCEVCNVELSFHWWIALGEDGFVAHCSRESNGPNPPAWKPNVDLEFTHYVSYNGYGGVDKRILRFDLEHAYDRYVNDGYLFRKVWELRVENTKPVTIHQIDVRLSPEFAIDKRDNGWRSWEYTFHPENYNWKKNFTIS